MDIVLILSILFFCGIKIEDEEAVEKKSRKVICHGLEAKFELCKGSGVSNYVDDAPLRGHDGSLLYGVAVKDIDGKR